jgi:hypothetical protein
MRWAIRIVVGLVAVIIVALGMAWPVAVAQPGHVIKRRDHGAATGPVSWSRTGAVDQHAPSPVTGIALSGKPAQFIAVVGTDAQRRQYRNQSGDEHSTVASLLGDDRQVAPTSTVVSVGVEMEVESQDCDAQHAFISPALTWPRRGCLRPKLRLSIPHGDG